ncbi:hypothetical protein HOF65_01255 [bacterium]|nr:hypothetical protein [bacterium]
MFIQVLIFSVYSIINFSSLISIFSHFCISPISKISLYFSKIPESIKFVQYIFQVVSITIHKLKKAVSE